MHMSLVRVNAFVWRCVKTVAATEDFASENRVVRTWMAENGVQEGDRIQPVYVQVDGMDEPALVWVVVAHTGLVTSVSEPPVGCAIAAGPPRVNRDRQPS